MKPGRRALGIAESYRGRDDENVASTLAGAVVKADRTVDDFVFGTCTVGGLDATDAVVTCWSRLGRPDVRYLFVAGVAPAWYNLLDMAALAEAIDRPVLAVSFEEGASLEPPLRDAFDGEELERRLARYERLPQRRRVAVADGDDLFVRAIGVDDDRAAKIVRVYTHEDRPDPLRVAKRAAVRADAFRRD